MENEEKVQAEEVIINDVKVVPKNPIVKHAGIIAFGLGAGLGYNMLKKQSIKTIMPYIIGIGVTYSVVILCDLKAAKKI